MAHVAPGIYLGQPWIEPFIRMEELLRYAAIPRCLQYLGCFFLIFLMVDRYMGIILDIVPEKENDSHDAERRVTEEKGSYRGHFLV